MYLCKTIYGILSFPFLIFLLPGFTWVLTRSHGTGYTPYGKCLPLVSDLNLYHKRAKEKHQVYDEKYLEEEVGILDYYINKK